MHVELVVPGLIPAREALQDAFDSARLATLELLVARGRVGYAEQQCFEAWLAQAFGLGDAALPAGALTVIADGGDATAGEARWMRADPVYLHLAREHLVLVPGAALSLTYGEVDALCEAVNQHFAGRLTLTPNLRRPDHWCARVEDAELPFNVPLLEAAGDDVDSHLRAQSDAANPGNPDNAARTADAASAHALLNELQMLLHDHPVNEAREARGEPAVNSVWFWGAGPAPTTAQGPWHSVSADEPLALGLARIARIRHRALEVSADSWLARAPEDGHHLIVLDGLRLPHALVDTEPYLAGLQALEARWFAPLLEALRVRRIGMLTLHAPDASEALSIETVRGDLRRFWRRPRALAPWKD